MTNKRIGGYKRWLDFDDEEMPESTKRNRRLKTQTLISNDEIASNLSGISVETENEVAENDNQLMDLETRYSDECESHSELEESLVDEMSDNDDVCNVEGYKEDSTIKSELQKKIESSKVLNVISTKIIVSEGELLCMFLKYAIFAELNHTAVTELFKAINCMFATDVLPNTEYFVDKLFFSNEFVKYHCICPYCNCYVGTFVSSDSLKVCLTCKKEVFVNSKNYNSFFVTLDTRNNIASLLERHSQYYYDVMNNRVHEPGIYRDITDGKEYREFVQNLPPEDRNKYVTLTFNCDGAATFESNTFSIYPIQLMINELPIDVRTSETIVGALWFGKSKPDMNVLLKGFVEDMNELSKSGVHCCIEGKMEIIKPFAICCSSDSVARAPMQDIKQFNGYYSCNWCLQRGEYVKNIGKKGGCLKFPLMETIPQKRTEDHFLNCLEFVSNKVPRTEKNQTVPLKNTDTENQSDINDVDNSDNNSGDGDDKDDDSDDDAKECNERRMNKNIEREYGVKYISPLNILSNFKMINGFVPDDMHFARLGIASQFTDYWFNSKTSPLPKTLPPSTMKEIDELLDSVTVPHQAMRLTKPLSQRDHWKAKEWENFILYLSLPVMELFLEKKFLHHWALFVELFYLSLKTVITAVDLKRIDYLIKQFLLGVEKLYTKKAMTYNVHQLMHWAECLQNWGPAWAHNAFPFESGNGKLLKMINAANGVTHQICRRLSMSQCDLILSNQILPQSSSHIQSYCYNLTNRNTQKTSKINSSRYFGVPKLPKADWIHKLNLSSEAVVYKRLVKNKCLYSCIERKNERSNNTYAQLINGSFVKLKEFIVDEELEKDYAIFKYLVTENAYKNQYPFLKKKLNCKKICMPQL